MKSTGNAQFSGNHDNGRQAMEHKWKKKILEKKIGFFGLYRWLDVGESVDRVAERNARLIGPTVESQLGQWPWNTAPTHGAEE